MASLANGRLHTRLGFHVLNTEERGVANRYQNELGRLAWAFLGSASAQFSPRSISCILDHWPPSIVGFGRHYLHDQVEGSLCMNFWSFHLGPREFSIQAQWSLPPLEASSHMVRAP
jgi:hypothetical protein